MLYKNDGKENQFFKRNSKYAEIFEFSEESLLEITNVKFINALSDKIFLFQIERIFIEEREECTNDNQIVYGYLNEDKSYHSINYIPKFVIKSLGIEITNKN